MQMHHEKLWAVGCKTSQSPRRSSSGDTQTKPEIHMMNSNDGYTNLFLYLEEGIGE